MRNTKYEYSPLQLSMLATPLHEEQQRQSNDTKLFENKKLHAHYLN